MFWNGRTASVMHELACQIAWRYRGAFRSYNVGVELSTGPILDCAGPQSCQCPFCGRSWWEVYRQTSATTAAIARGLRAGAPACCTATGEPWGWTADVPYTN